jgi:hypothetical protein
LAFLENLLALTFNLVYFFSRQKVAFFLEKITFIQKYLFSAWVPLFQKADRLKALVTFFPIFFYL